MQHAARRTRAVAVPALAALVLAAPAAAQEIRGQVVDANNGIPVALAGVYVLDGERSVVVAAAADTAGYYSIAPPGAGEYYLAVQRLGYFENETPLFEVGPDGASRRLRWSTPISGYRAAGALRLPMGGVGRWHDPDGAWDYIELTIDDVEYNVGR